MKIVSLFVLLVASVSAFAGTPEERCNLSGEISLTEATTIMCTGDLEVAAGTKIITNGFPLQILAAGLANFGTLENGLTIQSFSNDSQPGQMAAPVYLYARTASGFVSIQNQGSSDEAESGYVKLEYASVFNYDHNIGVTDTTVVDVFVNGLPFMVSYPQYKLVAAVAQR